MWPSSLFYVSSAFNTVDLGIRLERFEKSFGVVGRAVFSLRSYLSGSTQVAKDTQANDHWPDVEVIFLLKKCFRHGRSSVPGCCPTIPGSSGLIPVASSVKIIDLPSLQNRFLWLSFSTTLRGWSLTLDQELTFFRGCRKGMISPAPDTYDTPLVYSSSFQPFVVTDPVQVFKK